MRRANLIKISMILLNMLQINGQSSDLLSKIYDFLVSNPWSLILIPVVWFAIIAILQYGLDVHVSPWWGAMALIVSVLLVVGIIALGVI